MFLLDLFLSVFHFKVPENSKRCMWTWSVSFGQKFRKQLPHGGWNSHSRCTWRKMWFDTQKRLQFCLKTNSIVSIPLIIFCKSRNLFFCRGNWNFFFLAYINQALVYKYFLKSYIYLSSTIWYTKLLQILKLFPNVNLNFGSLCKFSAYSLISNINHLGC